MKYFVVWEDHATADIAAELVMSPDKVAIIDAWHELERALESDPILNGRPLHEGFFSIDRFPLRAIYTINDETKRVVIARTRRVS